MVAVVGRENPGPRPTAAGKACPRYKKPQNAKYVHGVTIIDRSRGSSLHRNGRVRDFIPSLLIGERKCRACYKAVQPCGCRQALLFDPDVNVHWTESSNYMRLGLPAVRKCEDNAMAEAKRLGMSCVILRSEHHHTATEFDRTGRMTGRFAEADWHITLNIGDARDKLPLAGPLLLVHGQE